MTKIFTAWFFCILISAAQMPEIREFLMVKDGNVIHPSGVVATPSEVAALSSEANTARGDALFARETVEAAFEVLDTLAATSNRVGFVNGNILSFGTNNAGADTNALCVIVSFEVGNIVNGMQRCFIGAWFSGAVDGAPEIITTSTLGGEMTWDAAPLLGFQIVNNMEVGGILFDPVFILETEVPASNAAFFRVQGSILQGGVGEFFRVYSGIQVGHERGLDLDITFNGQRMKWVGGVRVDAGGGQ